MQISDVVDQRIRADFSASDVPRIRKMLGEIHDVVGVMTPTERVHLAILTLAGGDVNKLEQMTEAANVDWRDVLVWAGQPTEAPKTWLEMKESLGLRDPPKPVEDSGTKTMALLRAFAAPVLYLLVLRLTALVDTFPAGSAASFYFLCGGIIVGATSVGVFARFTGLKIKVRANYSTGLGWAFIFCVGFLTTAIISDATGVTIPKEVLFRIILAFSLVGIAEELTFRAVCLSSLNRVTGSGFALISSSVLFGLAHFSNLWAGQAFATTRIQVVSAMLGGLFYGWIYLKLDGGLWVVALAHAIYDGSLVVLALSQTSLVWLLFAIFPVGLAAGLWLSGRTLLQRAKL